MPISEEFQAEAYKRLGMWLPLDYTPTRLSWGQFQAKRKRLITQNEKLRLKSEVKKQKELQEQLQEAQNKRINSYNLEIYNTFSKFVHWVSPYLKITPALAKICTELNKVHLGRTKLLILSMPPQEGKSTLIQLFCLFELWQKKNIKIAFTSYSENLAVRNTVELRTKLLDCDEFSNSPLFLDIRRDIAAKSEFQLKNSDSSVIAKGVGSGLTGRALDLLIIDDPVANWLQANSVLQMQQIYDWYNSVAKSRMVFGKTILIQTRWSQNDLAGRLSTSKEAKVLNIPAQYDPQLPPSSNTGNIANNLAISAKFYNEDGFLLSSRIKNEKSDKNSTSRWLEFKKTYSTSMWNALYLGDPAPLSGNIFKKEFFQYCDILPKFSEIVQSWDLSFSKSETSSYVACTVWGCAQNSFYLLDFCKKRLNFMETLKEILSFGNIYKNSTVLIEKKANGDAVVDTLSGKIPKIIPIKVESDKLARAHAST